MLRRGEVISLWLCGWLQVAFTDLDLLAGRRPIGAGQRGSRGKARDCLEDLGEFIVGAIGWEHEVDGVCPPLQTRRLSLVQRGRRCP